MRSLLLLCLVPCFFFSSCIGDGNKSGSKVKNTLYPRSKTNGTWISAHRGGSYKNFPENCLETFQFVADSIAERLIIECDVRLTADNRLVLLHDESLDRCTNGSGKLAKYKWSEIQRFRLKDKYGHLTDYGIPTLDAVLTWASSSHVYLNLDVKRNVPYEQVIDLILKHQMTERAYIITYNLDQAKAVYYHNSQIGQSVSVRNNFEWNLYQKSPLFGTHPVIGFTGTRLSKSDLYKKIQSENIPTILGTLGNLDKRAQARGMHLYDEWLRMGIDIFATDIPLELDAHLTSHK